MAIGPDQKVTTTGLMDNKPTMPNAPDLSALGKGQQQSAPQKAEPMAKRPEPEQPNVNDRIDQVGQANPESIAQVDLMLSDPDINDIMQKLAPEAAGKIAQFKGEEKIVALPSSIVKNYAMKMYGGDEQSSVQQFLTDLSGEQPDNTNVPPDTATESTGMMTQQSDDLPSDIQAIDEGIETV